MGDPDPYVSQASEKTISDSHAKSGYGGDSSGSAFHSQLEHVAQQQQFQPQQHSHPPYGQQSFDMSSMSAALPPSGIPSMVSRQHHGPGDAPGMFSPASVYHMQQASQYAAGRNQHFDPMDASRAQQQYLGSPYGSYPQQANMSSRSPMQYQSQAQYGQMDPYAYGYNPAAMSHMDPRFATPGSYSMMPNFQDPAHYARRTSEPASVPTFPRGPPRKPKQSGHALWVGNLPPAATVTDLKDHFSRDATKEIESLFLISKSNCAFVNYRSEAACVAAMNRFHDSRFHGVRLVCRLRRGSAAGSNSGSSLTPPTADALGTTSSGESIAKPPSPAIVEEPSSPTIVGSSSNPSSASQSTSLAPASSGEEVQKAAEKYFIVKSLTVQDLEASVRNGIWATQSHNEVVLNRAFEEADNVYLIFSANKSGEYFGYARMESPISGQPVDLSASSRQEEAAPTSGAPQSIPTPATATAPKGRIIDDSARGTIFWEAEHSEDEDDDESPAKSATDSGTGQSWGRQFTIQWMSTTRLPFYRTRGLRNPWNANREVKIARDGTELEPSVGRRLVQMFHRPSPGPAMPQPGMPLR